MRISSLLDDFEKKKKLDRRSIIFRLISLVIKLERRGVLMFIVVAELDSFMIRFTYIDIYEIIRSINESW